METILGLVMIYAWVHSIIIISTKVQGVDTYEKAVLIAGAVGIALYIIGTV